MNLTRFKPHPLYGAEILGTGVAKPIEDATFAAIRASLAARTDPA